MSLQTDPKYGDVILHQWFKQCTRTDLVSSDKLLRMYDLLVRIIVESTDTSGLQFHTLFTRMAYIGTVRKLPPGLLYNLHMIRKEVFTWVDDHPVDIESRVYLMSKVGADLIAALYDCKIPPKIQAELPNASIYHQPEWKNEGHRDFERVELIAIDEQKCTLTVLPEDSQGEITVRYDVTGKNDQFNSTIKIIQTHFTFPVSLYLVDVEIDDTGAWIPSAIVLLPDYLLDVTAVADSLQTGGVQTLSYILRKFLPIAVSLPILMGNIVNYFLDELISDPKKSFNTLKKQLFRLSPLSFALMDDRTLRNLLQDLKVHFITLFQLTNGGFQQQGIHPEHSVLEPTFYSEKYGLQGRLDLFYPGGKGKAAIVELKSGKPFRPNKYGLNQSHYLQTLLYDLLVQSVFHGRVKPTSYILYSINSEKPLRFAPVVRAQQYEALAARNELIGIEMQLCNMTDQTDPATNLLTAINVGDHPGLIGFVLRDVMEFEKTYRNLNELEKRYFLSFTGMIAREHRLAKVGMSGREGMEGQAALWQRASLQKEQSFELLGKLTIADNKAGEEDPVIVLKRTKHTHPLANFRSGDIVVLYPELKDHSLPTKEQLLKCSIIHIDAKEVMLRLRARQINDLHFEGHKYWNLEQDHLDSSFLGLSRGLFEWAKSTAQKRRLILALEPPRQVKFHKIQLPSDLTEEQKDICSRILQAEDYFLLWGPPGTGKTSKMLHHIVRHLLTESKEQIMLMAYTNRAVDEMCEAIEAISPDVREQYIRIGSRYGADPIYRERLLDNQAANCETRQELLDVLANQRIVVGTMAAIQGKPELFELMHFDRLIVDEASQILEPSMAGMMVKFDKVLLIGDHRQLSAVVAQDPALTRVSHEQFKEIGLNDLRNSLFERLYNNAQRKGWDWAYARLSHQGRMHRDIMDFPNRMFYEGGLHILPFELKDHFQTINIQKMKPPVKMPAWGHRLMTRRVNFIPTVADEDHVLGKVNRYEAELVIEIIQFFRSCYAGQTPEIGVITPYRAQIATILYHLQKVDKGKGLIQIDTVERFQGGAKDIIILSLCANYPQQLRTLVSLSSDGIDRKLNVALTRARKHLIVLGNPDVLVKDERYREFMSEYRV